MKGFKLLSIEEEQRLYELTTDPAVIAADKRRASNARLHCRCGRFVKPGRYRGEDLLVDCSSCGAVAL